MRRGRSIALLLAPLLLLAGCDEKPKPSGAAPPELLELVRNADLWASRADAILTRSWIERLRFRERLYARLQALRSYVEEGSQQAKAAAGPFDRLIERGRGLVNRAERFDQALALIEKALPSLDGIVACERMIELQLTPLESRGEAPLRLRFTDLEKQVKLGVTHLDETLTRILEGASDAATHQSIAIANLASALATGLKLTEEIKQIAIQAGAATSRRALLDRRIAWAESVQSKLGKNAPDDSPRALDLARAFAKDLRAKTEAVVDGLRNAQPGAIAKAQELAAAVDQEIERLTKAFLDAGRKAGVPDPK